MGPRRLRHIGALSVIRVVRQQRERRRFKGLTAPSTFVKRQYGRRRKYLPEGGHNGAIVHTATTDDDIMDLAGDPLSGRTDRLRRPSGTGRQQILDCQTRLTL
jgi:hypothetical protein